MPLQSENHSPHKQLRHLVTERLRLAILEGELKPGEWLRQEHLAQILGVSQMPVREAFKELAAEGLVEHVPYRGVRVVEFSPEDIADLYAHRGFLEGRAAYAAARNIQPEELQELKSTLARMSQLLGREHLAEYRDLNRHFHQIVYKASRHDYLIRTLNQMWTTFPSMLLGNFSTTAVAPLPERDASDIEEHQQIINALEQRDSESAERLVRQHIIASGERLVATLKISQ